RPTTPDSTGELREQTHLLQGGRRASTNRARRGRLNLPNRWRRHHTGPADQIRLRGAHGCGVLVRAVIVTIDDARCDVPRAPAAFVEAGPGSRIPHRLATSAARGEILRGRAR